MPERKLAAITGASSGIGAEFARKLAARGYDLLLIARRGDRLRSLAAEVGEMYRVQAEAMTADLTEDAGVDRVAARIGSAENLAILVNNAGFGTQGFFFEASVDSQDQMHRLHVLATLRLTHAALANMVRRGAGAVINVASVAGFGQSPQSVSYSATKTWMISFTEGLAIELAVKGSAVKVQALCPGFTLSEFHDVLGIDRSAIPKWLWMTAGSVVTESLRALGTGKVVVVPGWRYRWIAAGIKMMPYSIMRRVATKSARRFRQPRR